MAKIRGVLFDYGLVLSGPPDETAWSRLRALFAAPEEAFHAAYWRPRHDYDRGALTGDPYWHRVAEELKTEVTPELLGQAHDSDVEVWTQPNREMIEWAAALQGKGLRTAILSNLGDAMETGVRERCGWLSGFDHLTFSHRLGTAKPDPSIYLHAVQGLGLAPEEILFVDDREENIAAARALGMQAICYVDHARFIADLKRLQTQGNSDLPLPAAR